MIACNDKPHNQRCFGAVWCVFGSESREDVGQDGKNLGETAPGLVAVEIFACAHAN